MATSRCIYRFAKKGGTRCEETCVHDTKFCALHRRLSSTALLHDVHEFLGDTEVITAKNIYECFQRFGDYTSTIQFGESVEFAFQCMEVCSHLFSHQQINDLSNELHLGIRHVKKLEQLMGIILLMTKLLRIQKFVNAIRVFQSKWRKRHVLYMGPYPAEQCVNDADVFTMESIASLPIERVFSYLDGNGQIYAFDALQLSKHVFVFHKLYNPYTRERIPDLDIIRLDKWWHKTEREEVGKNWATPLSAFVDATSEIEQRYGIYTQPEWYLRLDEFDITGVFHKFHVLAGRGSGFMNVLVDEDAFDSGDIWNSQMALATEMYRLAVAGMPENVLFYVFCLFGALASYSDIIASSIPSWITETLNM